MYLINKIQFQSTRLLSDVRSYGNKKPTKNVKCVHIIKCAKVCALFAENKLRFARAEQLWQK